MHELMTMVSGWLVSYLTHSAVTLAILGAMAWLGDRLLRRVGPLAQHRMWVAALLVGVVLPLLPAGWLLRWFGHAHANAVSGAGTVTYSMIAAGAGHWAVSPLLSEMLAGAYLLTVLFCVSRLLWRWRRTRAMAPRAAALTLDPAADALVEGAALRFGVTAPEIHCSAETRGPVVLGLRRALLLVPEGFFAPDGSEDARAALAHECAHIARRDYAKNLFYEYAAAVVSYHPACWLMRRRIAETRELVCDEMAAGAVGGRPEYAASLLRLATAMARAAARPVYVTRTQATRTQAIGVFDADILEERIMRLTMDLPAVSRTRKIAMATVAACALMLGAGTAMALSFDVTPQDGAAAAAPLHEKVYKVGGDVTPPVLTYSVDAEFPDAEKNAKQGLQGVAVVELIVDSKGGPRDIRMKRSLRPDFDKRAINAVRQYKFDPAMRKGKPVAVAITIEVNFRRY
jgi:TonB family protein